MTETHDLLAFLAALAVAVSAYVALTVAATVGLGAFGYRPENPLLVALLVVAAAAAILSYEGAKRLYRELWGELVASAVLRR